MDYLLKAQRCTLCQSARLPAPHHRVHSTAAVEIVGIKQQVWVVCGREESKREGGEEEEKEEDG